MSTLASIEAQSEGQNGRSAGQGRGGRVGRHPDGLSIPDELVQSEERLTELAEARAKIEARARDASTMSGPSMKPGLRRVTPTLRRLAGNPGPNRPSRWSDLPTDQINLTEEESRIVLVAGGSFEQCYNAQALVVVLTGADFLPDLPVTMAYPQSRQTTSPRN